MQIMTKNLYFDVSTVAEGLDSPGRETFARRIRQVGLSRVLYGTDPGSPAERWAVVLKGRYFDRATLDKMMAGVETAYR
jgi:predicted TIM-barrel fold metal-dependent hydrolase